MLSQFLKKYKLNYVIGQKSLFRATIALFFNNKINVLDL